MTEFRADEAPDRDEGYKLKGEVPLFLIEAGKTFSQRRQALFGPEGGLDSRIEGFKAPFDVKDSTTLKTHLTKALEGGLFYYKKLKQSVKYQVVGDKEIAMYERALAAVNGQRSNLDSLFKVVDWMADSAVNRAERRRVEEQKDLLKVYATQKVYEGQEINPYERGSINRFCENNLAHIKAVRDAVIDNVPKWAKETAKAAG